LIEEMERLKARGLGGLKAGKLRYPSSFIVFSAL